MWLVTYHDDENTVLTNTLFKNEAEARKFFEKLRMDVEKDGYDFAWSDENAFSTGYRKEGIVEGRLEEIAFEDEPAKTSDDYEMSFEVYRNYLPCSNITERQYQKGMTIFAVSGVLSKLWGTFKTEDKARKDFQYERSSFDIQNGRIVGITEYVLVRKKYPIHNGKHGDCVGEWVLSVAPMSRKESLVVKIKEKLLPMLQKQGISFSDEELDTVVVEYIESRPEGYAEEALLRNTITVDDVLPMIG